MKYDDCYVVMSTTKTDSMFGMSEVRSRALVVFQNKKQAEEYSRDYISNSAENITILKSFIGIPE